MTAHLMLLRVLRGWIPHQVLMRMTGNRYYVRAEVDRVTYDRAMESLATLWGQGRPCTW
jgi:hypothetical protein